VKRLSSIAILFLVTLSFVGRTALATPAPIQLDAQGERWARETLARLTTEEKIGQMIMVWAKVRFLNVHSSEYQKLREAMRTCYVGGFGVTVPVEDGQLVMSEPLEAAQLTNSLQRDSKYPLIFAADFERGLSMRLVGATPFPAAMAERKGTSSSASSPICCKNNSAIRGSLSPTPST
jgi:hypothetical protein